MDSPKSLPSAQYLRECFDYNPDTGDLIWRVRPRHHFATQPAMDGINKRCAGKIAGMVTDQGYVHIRVDGERILAHRVVWKMLNGKDPEHRIDHRNGNGADNRAANLREATRSQVRQSSPHRRGSASKYKGVTQTTNKKRWRATITIGKQCTYLGTFDTEEEAHAVYCVEAERRFGEFASRR
jgi:uncharacterized protein YdhG (YjbR/CyaY superfamily)